MSSTSLFDVSRFWWTESLGGSEPLFTIRQCFYVSAGIIWSGTLFMAAVVWFVLMPYERRKRFADGVARRGTLPVEVEEA